MSRTTKEGKRGKGKRNPLPKGKPDGRAVFGRHFYGSTEKILRRNRKTWTRLGNKRRRRLDKEEVARS